MKVFNRPDPIDMDKLNMRIYGSRNTICQELREIYYMSEDEEVKLKVRVAMAMAKKMAAKLIWYKETNDREKKMGKE